MDSQHSWHRTPQYAQVPIYAQEPIYAQVSMMVRTLNRPVGLSATLSGGPTIPAMGDAQIVGEVC
eukprot:5870534-Amphidinium_carterae.1